MSERRWDVFVTEFTEANEQLPEVHWGDVDEAHANEMRAIAEIAETPRWARDSVGNEDETFYVLHEDGNGCLERYTPKVV